MSPEQFDARLDEVVAGFRPTVVEPWPAPSRFAFALTRSQPMSKREVGSVVSEEWIDRINNADRRASEWAQEQIATTEVGQTAIRNGTSWRLYHLAKQIARHSELKNERCTSSLADIQRANRGRMSRPERSRANALVAVGPKYAALIDKLLPVDWQSL
jgi:hypothetical protein